MIPIRTMSESELNEAARQVARSFLEHESGGIFPSLPVSEKQAAGYMKAVMRYSMKTGQLYAVSEKGEGYCVYCERAEEKEPFMAAMRMFFEEVFSLGIEGFAQFTAMFMKAGESSESTMRREKRNYISVALLAVCPAYQGQGYMRQMLEEIFRTADEKNLPVILQTDTADKMERYRHLGMRCTGKRNMGYGVTYYDLVRDPSDKEMTREELR